MNENVSVDDYFYTDTRHENELPIGTRVKVAGKNCPFFNEWRDCLGIVVGYRFDRGGLFPSGWHYIRFDDDEKRYNNPAQMPYVHRDYLMGVDKR